MRRIAKVVVGLNIALGATAVLGVSQASASGTRVCDSGGGRTTLTRDREVRVYTKSQSTFACDRQTGNTMRLGATPVADSVDPQVNLVSVAGHFVAYSKFFSAVIDGQPGMGSDPRRLDVRTGRIVRFGGRGGCAASVAYTPLVVDRWGSVAWGCFFADPNGYGTIAVHILADDRRGVHLVTVISPPGLPQNMFIHGSTVSWSFGGQTGKYTLLRPVHRHHRAPVKRRAHHAAA